MPVKRPSLTLLSTDPWRAAHEYLKYTPFNADSDYSNIGWLYKRLAKKSKPVDVTLIHRLHNRPPVPTTSMFSRSDGIVTWQSCLHSFHRAGVQDIEIEGSHLAMGWNTHVLQVIAGRMNQRPGKLAALDTAGVEVA